MAHKIIFVLCSVREQRRGAALCDWLLEVSQNDDRFTVEVVDLKKIDLPYEMDFIEPSQRKDKKYPDEKIQKWSNLIDSSDAIIFVLPEYNHAAPASLKNAIDQIYYEWIDKAVGFIGYGGRGGGRDSIASLQYTAKSLGWKLVQPQINIKGIKHNLDDDGNFKDTADYKKLLELLLNDIDRELNH